MAEGTGDPNADLDAMLRAQQSGSGGAVGLEVSLALKQVVGEFHDRAAAGLAKVSAGAVRRHEGNAETD
eukprot:6500196-Alexandrium_andersonii.AAC.1